MTECRRRRHSRWTTCECEACTLDRYRTTKANRMGRLDRVASEDAWARIDEWLAAGFTPRWIETACGLSVRYLQHGLKERLVDPDRLIGPNIAHKIVTADITQATLGRRDALGTRRRLQALAVAGWTVMELAARYDASFVSLARIQRGEAQKVGVTMWRLVRDMYADLEHQTGPSREARRRALEHGWYPPAQWDDPDTDPAPDQRRGRRDTLAEYEHLIAAGESPEQALAQLGVTANAIERATERERRKEPAA